MDGRAQEETKRLKISLEAYFYQTTGWKLNSAFDAAKGAAYEKRGICRRKVSDDPRICELVPYRGSADPTNAAMRQLFNIRKTIGTTPFCRWGIRRSELPEILPGAFLGGLRRGAAPEEIGLYACL